MTWIKFSVLLVCLLAVLCPTQSANQTVPRTPKPGVCPKIGHETNPLCGMFCGNDTDCVGDEKCCDSGCGRFCHEPVTPTVNVTRPGHCPPAPGEGGLCVRECDGDGECPEQQKCCNNGCGDVCVDPMPVVMTTLPPVYPACPESVEAEPPGCEIINTCTAGSCPHHGQICCNNGCGSICVDGPTKSPDKLPSPSTVTPDIGESCDDGWTHNKSCYKFQSIPENYHLADMECSHIKHQSHLADFHEKNQYTWAQGYLERQNDFNRQKPIWIGLHKSEDGDWVWSDGALLVYNDTWLDDQPDVGGSVCGASRGLHDNAGFLNSPCRDPQQYLCEYELVGTTRTPPQTKSPEHQQEPTDDLMENLRKIDNVIIAVIVIAVVVTVFGIGGTVVYCVRAKPKFVHRRLRKDDEMTIIDTMDI